MPRRCWRLAHSRLASPWRRDAEMNTGRAVPPNGRLLPAASSRPCVYASIDSTPDHHRPNGLRRQFLCDLQSSLKGPVNGRAINITQQRRVESPRLCLGSLAPPSTSDRWSKVPPRLPRPLCGGEATPQGAAHKRHRAGWQTASDHAPHHGEAVQQMQDLCIAEGVTDALSLWLQGLWKRRKRAAKRLEMSTCTAQSRKQ